MLVSSKLPKISCLLVTAPGRFDYFKKSVWCYVNQTYSNKQLVIVNEGPEEYQKQIADHVDGMDDVKLVFLNGYYTLGALRNISMALCDGELWVQWDDDDFNTPERLSVQYSFLSRKPKAKACFLSDQLHYYFPTKELYWEHWLKFQSSGMKKFGLIPGTCMAYRNIQARYPSAGTHCSAGEDSIFASRILDQDDSCIELLDGYGCMQVYSYHGKNVWDIEHHTNISKCRSMSVDHMIKNKERICHTIQYLGFEGEIKVMGREGLAFTYRGDHAE